MDRANHCCAQYGLSPSQGRGLGAMGTMRASLAARAHRCGGLYPIGAQSGIGFFTAQDSRLFAPAHPI